MCQLVSKFWQLNTQNSSMFYHLISPSFITETLQYFNSLQSSLLASATAPTISSQKSSQRDSIKMPFPCWNVLMPSQFTESKMKNLVPTKPAWLGASFSFPFLFPLLSTLATIHWPLWWASNVRISKIYFSWKPGVSKWRVLSYSVDFFSEVVFSMRPFLGNPSKTVTCNSDSPWPFLSWCIYSLVLLLTGAWVAQLLVLLLMYETLCTYHRHSHTHTHINTCLFPVLLYKRPEGRSFARLFSQLYLWCPECSI